MRDDESPNLGVDLGNDVAHMVSSTELSPPQQNPGYAGPEPVPLRGPIPRQVWHHLFRAECRTTSGLSPLATRLCASQQSAYRISTRSSCCTTLPAFAIILQKPQISSSRSPHILLAYRRRRPKNKKVQKGKSLISSKSPSTE